MFQPDDFLCDPDDPTSDPEQQPRRWHEGESSATEYQVEIE